MIGHTLSGEIERTLVGRLQVAGRRLREVIDRHVAALDLAVLGVVDGHATDDPQHERQPRAAEREREGTGRRHATLVA